MYTTCALYRCNAKLGSPSDHRPPSGGPVLNFGRFETLFECIKTLGMEEPLLLGSDRKSPKDLSLALACRNNLQLRPEKIGQRQVNILARGPVDQWLPNGNGMS